MEPSLEFSDQGVRRVLPDGRVEQVGWDELAEVQVMTTSDGPFTEDVFFVLFGRNEGQGCVVPHSKADDSFLRRLQALPGFDNEALIRAMISVVEDQFLLWRAP
jgi:hypothetical protein